MTTKTEPAWLPHDGSGNCPVPKGHDVEIKWGDGSTERRSEHASSYVWKDWPNNPTMCITHYRDWTAFEQVKVASGMVLVPITMIQNIRAQLEPDRLIEQGRAMKGEIDRCPVRQMCRALDDMIPNTGEGA
jgi:hypothetical protein